MQDISQRERLALYYPHLFQTPFRDNSGVMEGVPFELTEAQRNILDEMNRLVMVEKGYAGAEISKEGIARMVKSFDKDQPYVPPKGLTPDERVAPCGRNDQCPCGSGKKFKRCCIGTVKKGQPIIKVNHADK